MITKLDPHSVYVTAYHQRQGNPITLSGNPYKIVEARRTIAAMLETARNALEFEKNRSMADLEELIGCCVAHERNSWAAGTLAEGLPQTLGYNAVPGLEAMKCSRLLLRFTTTVRVLVLPWCKNALTLQPGEPMMDGLKGVLESTLALIDETLTALRG